MLTLYLLRHAKSSWDTPRLADHERPLAARGVRAARAMARFMEREHIEIQQVFCSSAARARQTCDIVIPDSTPDPVVTHDLYMATPGEMLALLQREADRRSPVILIGHNPGMESLAQLSCGAGPSDLLDRLARKFPTGALAEIEFEPDSWSDVKPHSGTLRRFVRPKDLPEAVSERP